MYTLAWKKSKTCVFCSILSGKRVLSEDKCRWKMDINIYANKKGKYDI